MISDDALENTTIDATENGLAKGTTLIAWIVLVLVIMATIGVVALIIAKQIKKKREAKNLERGVKMVPMLIHLPPSTDDIQGGSRDERDVTNEALSQAQIMYSIISSTLKKGWKTKIYGQRHVSFEIVAADGLIKYYAVVPAVITETVKQAIVSAYPTARLEEAYEDNIFSKEAGIAGVSGGELTLRKEYVYPIATYEDMKWDASSALLNALSAAKEGEGMAMQLMFRPTDGAWTKNSEERTKNIRDGNKKSGHGIWVVDTVRDLIRLPVEPMGEHPKDQKEPEKPLTSAQQEEIGAIEEKARYPGFEVLIRVIASSRNKARSDALIGGVVSAFSQFNSQTYNGFKYNMLTDERKLAKDFIFRIFPQGNTSSILNTVELATIFHLPSQNTIPNSQVERQLTKQVDGPAKLVTEGILLGVNEFRGQKKEIRLADDDRRRHVYIIGQTGMGKSVLMGNLAYQDMLAGKGFAFIDPHGDVVEEILSKVPPERIDDVIYFDPGDIEHPMGMNMFEWETEDQKDFIVQEGINMLQSLYDPGNQGFFGPRGQHMFRNAALLLMSDPNGATFIDIPRCFIDPEFVKSKLQYVTDKAVYDYWTKEFPASQKSNDAGEVITWFASKWGPFLSNTMMKNILGQVHSGFNIRDIMDNNKILLVNLSKGKMGEINSKLLGMIFVMKFQTAAMSRVDTPEDERKDFCLFVDEFQNFSTESFESILSEARKFRLNLVIANQFMTQLTDKIREGILGNVGTIIAGRVGITDAEMLEKAFLPVFNAEDLHKQPNHHAITTVMMYGVPSTPFTMNLIPPLGVANADVLETLKLYSATKYGRTRAEVDAEINKRMGEEMAEVAEKPEGFLEKWMNKRGDGQESATKGPLNTTEPTRSPEEMVARMQGEAGVDTAINKSDGPVFDNVVPDEDVEQAGGKKAEDMAMPDSDKAREEEVFKIR
ncbi:type IV secretory system conjugative DNA transfer family protein [Candidatus Saccharibacteria bacterium]|nr:type IV secretory system conjugative DNA transfer family protein [Candidatus Saccharibacteria bacterium]